MLSRNAKCRECGHKRGDHKYYSHTAKCYGAAKCPCLEFEVQIEDKVYETARKLQKELDYFDI